MPCSRKLYKRCKRTSRSSAIANFSPPTKFVTYCNIVLPLWIDIEKPTCGFKYGPQVGSLLLLVFGKFTRWRGRCTPLLRRALRQRPDRLFYGPAMLSLPVTHSRSYRHSV